jgi:protein-disulfide isomerase
MATHRRVLVPSNPVNSSPVNRSPVNSRLMSSSPVNSRLMSSRLVRSTLALLLSLSLPLLSIPQTSAAPIDPKLREQVLQILRENPEVILETLRSYQQQQDSTQAKARKDSLANVQRNLPSLIGQSPSKGAALGPAPSSAQRNLVLIEFSDFQCPYCAKSQSPIGQFLQKHPNITLVFKHFPLSMHPEAMPAAKAAWAAAQQGKFWPFHDALFAHQDQLGERLYTETAQKLKLDLVKFGRDRTSPEAQKAIQQDMLLAKQLGIEGTPFFYMNGQTFYGGRTVEEFEKVMQGARP